MKKITAYKCEFCSKILNTYSGMSKHEKKCFWNPLSNSCITCSHLTNALFIGDRLLTDQENKIYNYKIEGTYQNKTGFSLENDFDYQELNDEYKYLSDCEHDNYCEIKRIKLNKLRTNCERHGS